MKNCWNPTDPISKQCPGALAKTTRVLTLEMSAWSRDNADENTTTSIQKHARKLNLLGYRKFGNNRRISFHHVARSKGESFSEWKRRRVLCIGENLNTLSVSTSSPTKSSSLFRLQSSTRCRLRWRICPKRQPTSTSNRWTPIRRFNLSLRPESQLWPTLKH